mmetsp:Transcript_2570/g.9813  ORF Transcript_2570/g.9813 Transcript_2570/m.9813 type:complete len:323 (-) Transcript_2570:200-1168(-)|eukprot:CAMPEP_0117440878 /NCGR_PEP_ID=MMETSP0759-20121206/3326_1 /TAXON_ID=63605 /ORGANISM="Percolomonas cosmopolitus, Strain WS" /LENGTH=322 /DNA_ID=CAMNT_0005232675 /DNA_START=134 /DNA_END=1102 /DNA_ORIENTATION=+
MTQHQQIQNPVQNKLPCIYKTQRVPLPSKNKNTTPQKFKIVATPILNESFGRLIADRVPFTISEKVDGTSCFVHHSQLHKRRDLKLTREGTRLVDAHFAQQEHTTKPEPIKINLHKHFQPLPNGWIMAKGARANFDVHQNMIKNERHCIGWMPVQRTLSDDKWHCQPLDWDNQTARLVVPTLETTTAHNNNARTSLSFQFKQVPLSDLEGKSLELIGPKIQRNVYAFPKKATHAFVVHGSIPILNTPTTQTHSADQIKEFFSHDKLRQFLQENPAMEGLVVHFKEGQLFKVHRNHLDLAWPLKTGPHKLHLLLDDEMHTSSE